MLLYDRIAQVGDTVAHIFIDVLRPYEAIESFFDKTLTHHIFKFFYELDWSLVALLSDLHQQIDIVYFYVFHVWKIM